LPASCFSVHAATCLPASCFSVHAATCLPASCFNVHAATCLPASCFSGRVLTDHGCSCRPTPYSTRACDLASHGAGREGSCAPPRCGRSRKRREGHDHLTLEIACSGTARRRRMLRLRQRWQPAQTAAPLTTHTASQPAQKCQQAPAQGCHTMQILGRRASPRPRKLRRESGGRRARRRRRGRLPRLMRTSTRASRPSLRFPGGKA
jgi:hypothetical protein